MHALQHKTLLLLALVAALVAYASAFVPSTPSLKKTTPALLGRRTHLATTPATLRVVLPKAIPTPTTTTTLFSGEDSEEDEDIGPIGLAATGLGLVACPVVLYSEYVLYSTGCGLPAGPGGALGALEGISYLTVAGVFLWSIVKKVRTGTGLPAGPAGLLGAVEGLAFVAVLAGAVVLGLNFKEYGSIPEAVPTEGGRCSGI